MRIRSESDPDAGGGPAVGSGVAQVLDARLLPAALCCWGATVVVLTAGRQAGVALAAVSATLAIGLWVLLRLPTVRRDRRRRAVVLVVLAAVLLGAGFAGAVAWREHRVATHPLRALSGLSLRVVVTPTGDPTPLRTAISGNGNQWMVRADLRQYRRADKTVRVGGGVVVLATGPEWAELSPGRPVEFLARVDQPRRADLTVVTLRAQGSPVIAGPLPWWQHIANSIRTDFAASAARALPADAAGLLPALVVGDVSKLPDQVRADFEIAGLQHVCVVSGANFTILLSIVLFIARLLTLGPRVAVVVAAVALLMFVVVARPDPSVLRAGAMGAITLLAVLTGRRKQALPALCAAIIVLLAFWPGLAVSAGFALSVVATGGLILLAPSWADWLLARGWWRVPAEIVAVSAGAFLVTTPIMIALTGELSLVAVFANILVAPVIAPITVIGACGAVLSCLWSTPAELVLCCTAPPLWWLLTVAGQAAALPGAVIAVPGGLGAGLLAGVVVVLVIAVLRSRAIRRVIAVVLLGVAAVVLPVRFWQPGWPPNGWVLAACDIGQGDGLALATGPGTAVVIDVGPDPRTIRRCLDGLRISRIPLLILTHPHADHIGGLAGALHDRTVDALAVGVHELGVLSQTAALEPARSTRATGSECPTRGDDPASSSRMPCGPVDFGTERAMSRAGADRPRISDTGLAQVVTVARSAGVPLLELAAGQVLDFGSVELEVLAPSRSGPRPVRGAETDGANDRSVVVAADTPAGRILLTGDIEAAAQRALLRAGAPVRADILKLPHHGSRTTAREFLTAVHPRLVLVSVGAGNSFGHPHPDVLADLSALGATVARTDRHGDIVLLGNGGQLRMTSSRRAVYFGATRDRHRLAGKGVMPDRRIGL
ncbi:ComEC/Rec2 family competence protein [Nocardia sp. 004]|uniref:ComEC/Rec2 family competence protein n=1 Tax=Nocardia sp. 004 TaxID=3385978 RepID=UPI0039A07534